MNETIVSFLKSLNINFEKFNALEGSKLKRNLDVNPLLSGFAIFKPNSENKKISITDVVGYDYHGMNLDRELLNNLSEFFDKDGDGYHRRSVSMLDVPQSQIMTQLNYSFKREPICLMEVDKGVYNIGNNGLHRFHVIKTHFLDELSKLNPSDKNAQKKLIEKYSFEANVSEIDFVKSYSSFLLNLLDENLSIKNHYSSDFEFTGKACLINHLKPGEKIVLTDDQLIETVNKKINQFLKTASKKDIKQFNEIIQNAFKFESFKDYYNLSLKQIEQGEREWN